MGLLAKCVGVWPFVEGEDESFCLPVTTFPIVLGLHECVLPKNLSLQSRQEHISHKNPWDITINMVTFDPLFMQ